LALCIFLFSVFFFFILSISQRVGSLPLKINNSVLLGTINFDPFIIIHLAPFIKYILFCASIRLSVDGLNLPNFEIFSTICREQV